MSIYEFGSQFTFVNTPRGMSPGGVAGGSNLNPHIDPYAPGVSQLSHVQGGRVANVWEEHKVQSHDIEEFIEPGFRYLDSAMKSYWSDIRIPTKDAFRFVRTKIAGMNRGLQVWNEELKHGRVMLPVISISRVGHSYNPDKFTPAYGPLRRRFLNKARTMVSLHYRPVPYFVDYTLSIWAEHKRDAEYTLYQILTRFNPLAELTVDDGHNWGHVQMKMTSSSDNSDKEATAEQYAKVKYEIAFTAEAWLTLPAKVMPTIIGKVLALEIQ